MTAEIRLGEEASGRSCRTCRKWDGGCTDPRHSNDDPDKPCLLYRYREQQAHIQEQAGCIVCTNCGKPKPASKFKRVNNNTQTKQCIECRMKNSARNRKCRNRKKEEE